MGRTRMHICMYIQRDGRFDVLTCMSRGNPHACARAAAYVEATRFRSDVARAATLSSRCNPCKLLKGVDEAFDVANSVLVYII